VHVCLLDVNVLIPLCWRKHENHKRVQSWFDRNAASAWATCPFTEAAFVRLISNPSFSRDWATPDFAISVLSENLNHPNHRFWPDELSVHDAIAPLRRNVAGHRQITDAYLLGLAIHRKGKLATFDRAIAAMVPEGVATNSVVELL